MSNMETAPNPGNGSAVVPIPVSAAVEQVYESRLDAIPDAGTEGIEGMLLQLSEATTADELDAPWQSGSLGRFVDVPIEVREIGKMPAEYDGPIPYFLVVRGAVLGTGEAFVATTGSVMVVAALAQAFHIGALPWRVILRERESRRIKGGKVHHLEVFRP